MIVVIYSTEGELWKGKLPNVPRVGELITINDKNRFGVYTAVKVNWHVCQKKVTIEVVEGILK